MSEENNHLYEFGPFRLETAKRRLSREGQTVPLTSKVFDILLALVQRSGRVVEKDELMNEVWPDSFVTEANITQSISVLRKTLGEGAGGEEFIQTVPKRGYCFVASVREVSNEISDPTLSRQLAAPQANPADDESVTARNAELAAGAGQSDEHDAHRPSDEQRRKSKWRQRPTSLALGIMLLGLTAAFTYSWISGEKDRAKKGEWQSLAVLPFKYVNGAGEDESLELGMADALITKLSRISQIKVRPTGAVLKYTSRERDPVTVGRELAVDVVLDGTVQRSEDRVRVTVQLVSVREGKHLWAESFNEKWTNIFAIQDAVANQVAQSLALQVSEGERELLAKHYTENAEAYEAYLKGRYFWNKRTEEGFRKGAEHFQRAMELDSKYAPAYAGLADCYIFLSEWGMTPAIEVMPKAKEAVLKALEIDEGLAEAHSSLARIRDIYDWDWAEAEREYKRAIELNPNSAFAHVWYGRFLSIKQRTDEADAEIRRAKEIDPTNLAIVWEEGMPYLYSGQCDKALEQFQKTVELDPNFWPVYISISSAHACRKDYESALAAVERAKQVVGDIPELKKVMAELYMLMGRKEETRKIFVELIEMSRVRYVPPEYFVGYYLDMGDKDKAFEEMERAYRERSHSMIYLNMPGSYEQIRSDPRFQDLLQRVGHKP